MPEHRIGIRVLGEVGEFYDRLTGERFVPRGNNLIRLAWQKDFNGNNFYYHSTFNVGEYDPELIEQNLQQMHQMGYNTVRVFIQGSCKDACIGNSGRGLTAGYISNLVDFLQKAKANDIFVILTTDGEPGTPYYINLLDVDWNEKFGGTNNLLRRGGVLVAQQFWKDLVEALIAQDAPLENILAYALRNELFFKSNAGPLNLNAGQVRTANGLTYDMASAGDKRRMMDEGLVFWIDSVRSAILEGDPTALVTVGFFWPQEPHPARIGDTRLIETRPAIWESSADFIDLHLYPDAGLTLEQFVDNYKMAGMQEKPIIIGEMGAARASYHSAAALAQVLQTWQVKSCGYGFDGWLLWTWDTEEQPDFYNGLAEDGVIARTLAPAIRPDPCQN